MAKKRMSRKELKQVDPVTEGLSSVLDAIVDRWKQLVSMFVVLVIALVAIGFYQDSADAQKRSRQAEISSAFNTIDLSKPDGLNQLEELIKNNEGSDLGAVATIMHASYAAKNDGSVVDAAKVRAAIQLLGSNNSALRPWSNLNLAIQGEGSLENATSETNPSASRVLAHMLIGDRNHAGFGHETADAKAAVTSYRTALKILDESLEVPRSTRQILRSEITTRIALLPGGSSEDLSKPEPKLVPAPQ